MDSEQIVELSVSELKPHPKNTDFFADMTGEKWEDFLQSVREAGIRVPLIITPEHVIVSGHQRYHACIALGIDKVPCIIRNYKNEDEVIYDLIEINVRQRNVSLPICARTGRIIKELERIKGVKPHSTLTSRNVMSGGEGDVTSKADLMEELDITKGTYDRSKALLKLAPEIQEMTGEQITGNAALEFFKNLNYEDQIAIAQSLPAQDKYTMKELEAVKKVIEEQKAQIEASNQEVADMERRLEKQVQKAAQYEGTNLDEEIERRLELEVEKKELKAKVADGEVKLRDARKDAANLRKQIDDLTEQVNNACTETVVEAPEDYEDLKSRIADLEEQYSDAQTRVAHENMAMLSERFYEDISTYISAVNNTAPSSVLSQVTEAGKSVFELIKIIKRDAISA